MKHEAYFRFRLTNVNDGEQMINRQMHAYAHGRLRTPMREKVNIIIKFEISNGNSNETQCAGFHNDHNTVIE